MCTEILINTNIQISLKFEILYFSLQALHKEVFSFIIEITSYE